ncbi:hypothetical protein GCM10009551_065550 [Nocardiopsis tropica]|uniref:protein kinase domain-containing protein n=1 Tax=Nocardiopsis tropica TaxID=109330 RepID=UPI0031E0E02C
MRRTSRREPPPPFPGMRDLTTLYCGRSALLYRAERESDRAPVVVKLLGRGPGTAGPDEAGLWDRLTPVPGVQPLLSSGVTGAGRAFAVTEYRGEGDYARALAEDGPLAVDEVLTVGRTVARALEGMHELGLLHHAVTPANILRGASGPTLTDFGSTLPLDHPFPPVYYTRAALDHAPPEEVAGSRPTPASDVYRLASTLWTLLAGHAPFAGPGQEETGPREYRSRLLSGTPPEMDREDVPDRLRAVLLRALATEPGRRTPTAAEFGRALEPGPVAQDVPDTDLDRTAAAAGSADDGPEASAAESEATVAPVPLAAAALPAEAGTGASADPASDDAGAEEAEPETATGTTEPESGAEGTVNGSEVFAEETVEPDEDTGHGPDDDGYTDGAWYDDDDEDGAWYEVDDVLGEHGDGEAPDDAGEPSSADSGPESDAPLAADSPSGTHEAVPDPAAGPGETGEPVAAADPGDGLPDGSEVHEAAPTDPPAPVASSTTGPPPRTSSPPVPDRDEPHSDAGAGGPASVPLDSSPLSAPTPVLGPGRVGEATGGPLPGSRPPSAERTAPSPFSFEAITRGAEPLTNRSAPPAHAWSAPSAPRTADAGSAWTDERHAPANATAWAPAPQPERHRTAVLLPVLIGLVLVTVVAVGALLVTGRDSGAPSAEAPAPAGGGGAAPEVPGGAAGGDGPAEEADPSAIAPTGVEVADDLVGVSLSWTDNTGGSAPHFVVGGPVGARTTSMANVPAGASTVDVSGLNPEVEYCFRVVAVRSTDVMAPSEEVCTDRGAAGG